MDQKGSPVAVGEENAMPTVNPVQTTSYYLPLGSTTNFGSGTDIDNSTGVGNIAAVYARAAYMTNTGKISEAFTVNGKVYGDGVYMTLAGAVTNYGGGSISGGAIGVDLAPFYGGGGIVTNAAGATISGGNDGVRINSTDGSTATVTNAGTITQTGGTAVNLNNEYAAVLLRHNGSVTNETGGIISGPDAVILLYGGTVTNMAGATINGLVSWWHPGATDGDQLGQDFGRRLRHYSEQRERGKHLRRGCSHRRQLRTHLRRGCRHRRQLRKHLRT
jgi:hypothetical protein